MLADLLTGFDIDVHSGMNATSPEPLVTQLYQWSGEHWPRYFDKAIHNGEHWIASTKQDDNPIYSVIMDTAIVIGELIIKHRPTYCWSIDRAPGNKDMASYNRCVLAAPWLPEPERFVVIDIESRIAQRFLHAHDFGQRHEELWLRLLHACVSGGAEGAHLNY